MTYTAVVKTWEKLYVVERPTAELLMEKVNALTNANNARVGYIWKDLPCYHMNPISRIVPSCESPYEIHRLSYVPIAEEDKPEWQALSEELGRNIEDKTKVQVCKGHEESV